MTSPDPTAHQTPPEPPAPRRLTRSSTDHVLGGVAGGLGRYFDVDPILFRIGFAVATFAGGAGLLAYFALWFLVPDENGQGARRPDARNVVLIVAGGILLGLLVGLLPGPDLFVWPGFFGLLVLGVLVAAIVSADRGGDTRSRLQRAVIVTLAVMAAGLLGVFAAVGTAFGGGAVVAGIVLLLGLGLVAGAFGRGRRWLLVPALVLAAPAAFVQAADLRVEGGIGEREYRPISVSDMRDVYELGAGEMVIDLRDVEFPAGRTTTAVELGMGEVEVIVPDDVCVGFRADVGAGVVRAFGHEIGDVDFETSLRPLNEADAPELVIDAEVDFGALTIGFGDDLHYEGWGPFPWDATTQDACVR